VRAWSDMTTRRSCCRLICAGLLFFLGFSAVAGEPEIIRYTIRPSDFERASETLREAIENQGLIPGPTSHFGEMLARTGPVLGHPLPRYERAEIVSFCSASVSWALVEEDLDNIALCPLTIALYTLAGELQTVHLSYRDPGVGSAGLRRAAELMRAIARETVVTAGRVLPEVRAD
jgi:hypothetical protein